MIISNSRKYIFIHIMKAAGTSVTRALDAQARWNDLVIGGTPFGESIQPAYRQRFNLHKHSLGREVRTVVGPEVWDTYFTFTFVRHPYTRAVSLYTFAGKMIDKYGWKRHLRRLSFTRVSREPIWTWRITQAYLESDSFSEFIRNPNLRMIPQTDWILDEAGQAIVDFIGKVETVEADILTLSQKIGLEAPRVQQHNRSPDSHWTRHLNKEEDFALLQQLFAKDFEILGYDPSLRR